MRFVFGVHLHQPVGNFDHVFEEHARDVYSPLIDQLSRRHRGTLMLHLSGPLLEWLESHDVPLLDRVGQLAADGRIEFLLGGMYEPILASIPRVDRIEQIGWLRDALRARFGATGDGLWLTERVWEPELAFDLATAGVRYALVDDRHFLVSGFERDELHAPYRTENDGRAISLLAIDERLRYLIPFRPDGRDRGRISAMLRAAGAAARGRLPTTAKSTRRLARHARVGLRTRLVQPLSTSAARRARRTRASCRISGGAEALDAVPAAGLAYLPTASYREMEAWALPPRPALRLADLEAELGAESMAGPRGALVRGSHWRNFLTKYSESNRLQKKTSALSRLCRKRGDPPAARRAIGRAQCNDALWHGVFEWCSLPAALARGPLAGSSPSARARFAPARR